MIQFHQSGHNNNHFKVVWPTGYVVLSFKASLPGTQGPMSHFVSLPDFPDTLYHMLTLLAHLGFHTP